MWLLALLKKRFWNIWAEQKAESKPLSEAQIEFNERLAKIKQKEEQ